MTINFAAEASSKNGDLLKDLQARVSSGKVGNLNVDAGHILDVEPDVGKIFSNHDIPVERLLRLTPHSRMHDRIDELRKILPRKRLALVICFNCVILPSVFGFAVF